MQWKLLPIRKFMLYHVGPRVADVELINNYLKFDTEFGKLFQMRKFMFYHVGPHLAKVEPVNGYPNFKFGKVILI